MHKKIIGFILALLLLVGAVPASAAGFSQPQVSAIVSLLRAFGVEQSVIDHVSAVLGGATQTSSGNTRTVSGTFTYSDMSGFGNLELMNESIPARRIIKINTTNLDGHDSVAMLKEMGIDGSKPIGDSCRWAVDATVTIKEVSAIVGAQPVFTITNILSKGSPRQTCPGARVNPSPAVLSVTPLQGKAPLTVTIQPNFYELGDNYILFGDGTSALVTCAEFKPRTDACVRITPVTHTYTRPATYTLKQVSTPSDQDGYAYATASVMVGVQ